MSGDTVTKQFAAAGLLKLVEEGKVALDDPLSKYVPDYPNGDTISIVQLLNHTSGIKSYTGIPGYMDQEIKRDLDTKKLIAVFRDEEPDFEPGEAWAYNNSGYVLVGAVIEAASGTPWSDWLTQVLFTPLGLERTQDGATSAVIPGHVEGYAMAADGSLAVAPSLSMTQPHAAGALVSTVGDLVRWNEGLHGGKVLEEELYQRMITPEGAAIDERYGFGIGASTIRGQVAYTHAGGIHGFLSFLVYIPEEDVSVAVLRNATGPGSNPGFIGRRLAAIALGNPYPDAEPIDVALEDLEALQGVYRGGDSAARVLRVVDGMLTSQRTGGARYALMPIAPDTFRYEDSLSYFVIERDEGGNPAAMRFFANGEGEGVAWPRSVEPLPEP